MKEHFLSTPICNPYLALAVSDDLLHRRPPFYPSQIEEYPSGGSADCRCKDYNVQSNRIAAVIQE